MRSRLASADHATSFKLAPVSRDAVARAQRRQQTAQRQICGLVDCRYGPVCALFHAARAQQYCRLTRISVMTPTANAKSP